MDRRVKKDKLLHANLPTQHPFRADRQTHIRATTHSAESEVATSTPRPPPLMPAPAARPPPRRPAQAARPPPLMPAPAATSVRSTTVKKCMPPVLFKKPEGFVRAKKLITLQRPINETVISKISLEGSKSVNLNAESNKNFNIKSARLNDLLSNLQKKSYNQEEMKQFYQDQEEMRRFHENKKAGSLSFSIDSLLSPNKNQLIRDHIKKLRDVRKNVRYWPESSNNAALPAQSSESANSSSTT